MNANESMEGLHNPSQSDSLDYIRSILPDPEDMTPEIRFQYLNTIIIVLLKPKNLKVSHPLQTYAPANTGDEMYESMLARFHSELEGIKGYAGYDENNFNDWTQNMHYLLDVYMATVLNVTLPEWEPLHEILNGDLITEMSRKKENEAALIPNDETPSYRLSLFYQMYVRQQKAD